MNFSTVSVVGYDYGSLDSSDIKLPIRDASSISIAWGLAEAYSDWGGEGYKVADRYAVDRIFLQHCSEEKDVIVTGLKIASWVTIVLPVSAALVKTYYRSQYGYRISSA